ncbi:MAG TPA: iron-regulated protein A precursor, partial [bacterium]|nr:iron-regulated protein A precursor [bacterium]
MPIFYQVSCRRCFPLRFLTMKKMQKPLSASLLSMAILGLAACGGGGGGSDSSAVTPPPAPGKVTFDATAVIDNETDAVITQTYKNLNSQASALLKSVEAFKDGVTEAEMDTARTMWKATRVPWEASEGFLFGPVDALGIDPVIDSWPLNTPDLQAFLAAKPNATQADIDNASDDLRGFHAIEYLLFGDGVSINDKAASAVTAAEANYLVALAQSFKARTQELEDGWVKDFAGKGAYATLVKTAGAGNTVYSSQSSVMEELINGLSGIADEVANAKMTEPFGPSLEKADTSLVESQYSWNSLTDFHNNLQSVLNVYTGKIGYSPSGDSISANLNGVYAFVLKHDATLANRVLAEIIDAQQKIALIKGDGNPTTTAITGSAKP